MNAPHDPASGRFHLDKRIPLALILTILVQTGAGFWWASSITERVTALERWKDDSKEVAADIAVMKSQITDMKATLERIDARLSAAPRR